jgi:ankyrin repeat protein
MNSKATFSLVNITLFTLFSFGQAIFAMEKEITIFQAVKLSDFEAIKTLLDKKIDINCTTKDQLTPLHFAAWSGNPNTVKLLLNHHANINCVDNFNRTPLHWAAWIGSLSVSKELIKEKANINSRTIEDQTPLHLAAFKGHSAIVISLLKNGSEIDCKDSHGWTPLHAAAWSGDDEVVAILLFKKANIKCLTNDGKTALVLAQALPEDKRNDSSEKLLSNKNKYLQKYMMKLKRYFDLEESDAPAQPKVLFSRIAETLRNSH